LIALRANLANLPQQTQDANAHLEPIGCAQLYRFTFLLSALNQDEGGTEACERARENPDNDCASLPV
jgi:hypothetical protein